MKRINMMLLGWALCMVLPAMAANLRIVKMPDGTYSMTGYLEPNDLMVRKGSLRPLEFQYEYKPGGYYVSSVKQICPQDKTETLNLINRMLSGNGIPLNSYASYTPRELYHLSVVCAATPDSFPRDKQWGWVTPYDLIVPPVDENSPFCDVSIPGEINLGTVMVGQRVTSTLQGIITCDKKATVNVSLTDPVNKASSPGVLNIADAKLNMDIDGQGAEKNITVEGAGPQAFNLNVTLLDAGKTVGEKAGTLLLTADVL
ncbi:hypothetical protein [Pantoea sp. 1.19]|uniref:hypothetical protein n=1 Tax=Pantoea sp. 1.19 TaxID=1925589 RepID=UPI000948AE62|nr:hypothetical protein [Pantoea sp. 1.19]